MLRIWNSRKLLLDLQQENAISIVYYNTNTNYNEKDSNYYVCTPDNSRSLRL